MRSELQLSCNHSPFPASFFKNAGSIVRSIVGDAHAAHVSESMTTTSWRDPIAMVWTPPCRARQAHIPHSAIFERKPIDVLHVHHFDIPTTVDIHSPQIWRTMTLHRVLTTTTSCHAHAIKSWIESAYESGSTRNLRRQQH